MSAIRDALEKVILAAKANPNPPGQRGHVYIAGYRFNCQRDLSSTNSWKTGWWGTDNTSAVDQTAIGLLLRLMQSGVQVRVLVWLPPREAEWAGFTPHVQDHLYLFRVIRAENDRLVKRDSLATPIGIVGLDKRTASGALIGTHHQKFIVIRSPPLDVAFCGGVDLAFTRRDSPSDPTAGAFTPETVLGGDWQSGTPNMPRPTPPMAPGIIRPPDATTNYDIVKQTLAWDVADQQPSDLPTTTDQVEVCAAIGGTWNSGVCSYTIAAGSAGTPPSVTSTALPVYGDSNQLWHDQHLQLEGPIVSTLEWAFAERWVDDAWMEEQAVEELKRLFGAAPSDAFSTCNLLIGAVAFSTADVYSQTVQVPTTPTIRVPIPGATILPLDQPDPIVAPVGQSTVQLWRTIPMRRRTLPLFKDGEFTVMAGVCEGDERRHRTDLDIRSIFLERTRSAIAPPTFTGRAIALCTDRASTVRRYAVCRRTPDAPTRSGRVDAGPHTRPKQTCHGVQHVAPTAGAGHRRARKDAHVRRGTPCLWLGQYELPLLHLRLGDLLRGGRFPTSSQVTKRNYGRCSSAVQARSRQRT